LERTDGGRGPPADDEPKVAMTTTPPRRVLIAEDEALIRLDLSEMLADEGFQVIGEAGDGVQAVQLARELRPDLVIMDVKMPKKDGIDAAAEIVAEQIAPVVILTAFSQRDLIERARDAGAMAYLVKPFSQSDLLPAIELAVARHAEMVALRAEVADVTDRLEARKVIDRAKGLLMTNQKMSEPEAFRWIQRTAMDRRTSMQAIAQAVLEGLTSRA
jgi:response regulator NasT